MKVTYAVIDATGLRLRAEDEDGKPLNLHYEGKVTTSFDTSSYVTNLNIRVVPHVDERAAKKSNAPFPNP